MAAARTGDGNRRADGIRSRAVALARPSAAYPDPSWWGWGDAAQVPVLSERVLALLRDGLNVREPLPKPASLEDLPLGAPRLSSDDVDALAAVVGSGQARADAESRLRHTRGKSTLDLLRLGPATPAGRPTSLYCRAPTRRSWRCCASALRGRSRSCRSAGAPRSWAGSNPRPGGAGPWRGRNRERGRVIRGYGRPRSPADERAARAR